MKKLLLGIAAFFVSALSIGQPYGNEWIDYAPNRYYFRFKVGKDGIYRIPQTTLANAFAQAGVGIASVDPRSVQVFAKGAEQYIHIEGEIDGSFDAGDYIELYCEKNTGWVDERLYPSAAQHTNPFYSLVTDSLTYFVTWNPSGTHSAYRYTTMPFITAASTPLEYFIREQVNAASPVYHAGGEIQGGKSVTRYMDGKGWILGSFGYNATTTEGQRNWNVPTRNVYTAGTATVEMGLMGYNRGAGGSEAHHVRVQQRIGSTYVTLSDLVLKEFGYERHESSFAASSITATTHNVRAYIAKAGSLVTTTSDYCAVSYMRFFYPHTLSFGGESGLIETKMRIAQNGVEVHFNATNWPGGTTSFLYDPAIGRRYALNQSGTTLRCNIAAGAVRDLYLAANSAVSEISAQALAPVSDDGRFDDLMAIQRDSAYLIVTHKKLKASAAEYAAYRNATHSNRAVVVYMDELYDQFAYGLAPHPLAIRGFCDFAIDQWNTPPKFLLLLGKGYQENDHRKSAAKQAQCLVPTMGFPPSDNYLTMGLGDHPFAPAIATGRIAAQNDDEVRLYRTKISAQERAISDFPSTYTIAQKQWQKNILHFAGGGNASENQYFRSNLSSYQSALENPDFGGKVFLFSKTTSTVIEQLDVDTIRQLISNGVAVMCFFGHGTSSGFDINVDNPTEWSNFERYPVVVANSCFSGNIHSEPGIAEEVVFTPNEGAIAFVATPHTSLPDDLHDITLAIHNELSATRYGKSLGEQMMEAARTVSTKTIANPNNEAEVRAAEKNRSVALEMTLHGDPALRVYPHSRSELTINDPVKGQAVSIQPAFITTEIDSFDVVVHVSNLGHAVKKPVLVKATREYPTSVTPQTQLKQLDGLGYDDFVVFRFPVDAVNGVGTNDLTVEVDLPHDSIPEFDETTNNTVAALRIDIIDASISPVYPYNFAVVPSFDVTLKANTGFPFAPSKTYTIQIDTTDLYTAPIAQTQVTQIGAVVAWNPNLPSFGFKDSTVFFWRVAPSDDLSKWKEFSFQVIKGETGWGQAHFFQLKNNGFDFIGHNRTTRKLTFDEASRELFATTVGSASSEGEFYQTRYMLDGQLGPWGEYGVLPNNPPGMAIAVIDTIDLKPWGTYGLANGLLVNEDHQFGQSNAYNPNSNNSRDKRVQYWFGFNMNDAAARANMVNLIQNEVPDGYYLLAYTLRYANFETHWNDTMFQAFEVLGADSIRHVGNRHPYIFFTKKGSPELTEEVIGKFDTETIQLRTKVLSTLKQGTVKSPHIGPAMAWGSFHLGSHALESSTQDQVRATAIGLKKDGTEIYDTELTASGSTALTSDATTTPAWRLEYFTADNTNGTPAQLDHWHVFYDPAPDAAINPARGLRWTEKTITAGESLYFAVAIDNISEYDFDSLYVHYWVTGSGGEPVQEQWLAYSSLKAGASIFDSVAIATAPLDGRYTLWVEVNPRDYRWHKEQYHFNNRAYLPFRVSGDNNNPLLDVTFDGIHILNGDIVSPTPEIVMELKDENPYLMLKDTTSFDVFMTYPNGTQKRIPFVANGKEVMAFEPASGKKNKARVTYHPDPLADGTHKLTVMGRDASGNPSGKKGYDTEFEIINKSMVTHVMNYPNPFTTSTRFVFTLTGSRIPDVFTIQILTVTGKVVREITKNELGTIRIGRNITSYAWDGTDEYGDRLANGVYVYRVIMKIDGQNIERMESGADPYFTKEFGKMYLLR